MTTTNVLHGVTVDGAATAADVSRASGRAPGAKRARRELVARVQELGGTFDSGRTAYLEDVIPELEELRQVLERYLGSLSATREVGASTEARHALCLELANLVEQARNRCLGVPNPQGFHWVAQRFSLLRGALETAPRDSLARTRAPGRLGPAAR